jgi:hypothetical protein
MVPAVAFTLIFFVTYEYKQECLFLASIPVLVDCDTLLSFRGYEENEMF